jgi:hypothetical protein
MSQRIRSIGIVYHCLASSAYQRTHLGSPVLSRYGQMLAEKEKKQKQKQRKRQSVRYRPKLGVFSRQNSIDVQTPKTPFQV